MKKMSQCSQICALTKLVYVHLHDNSSTHLHLDKRAGWYDPNLLSLMCTYIGHLKRDDSKSLDNISGIPGHRSMRWRSRAAYKLDNVEKRRVRGDWSVGLSIGWCSPCREGHVLAILAMWKQIKHIKRSKPWALVWTSVCRLFPASLSSSLSFCAKFWDYNCLCVCAGDLLTLYSLHYTPSPACIKKVRVADIKYSHQLPRVWALWTFSRRIIFFDLRSSPMVWFPLGVLSFFTVSEEDWVIPPMPTFTVTNTQNAHLVYKGTGR